jgi:hypothetical protein
LQNKYFTEDHEIRGLDMRYEWRRENVNLKELDKHIRSFFIQNGFITRSLRKADIVEVVAIPTEASPVGERIRVELEKIEGGFALEITNLTRIDSSILGGLLSSFLGGGSLVLRGVKIKDRLEILEKELVHWIDNF